MSRQESRWPRIRQDIGSSLKSLTSSSFLRIFTLLALAITIVHCGASTETQKNYSGSGQTDPQILSHLNRDGGLDGAGTRRGEIEGSTAEEVRTAIRRAIEMANEKGPKNIFVQLWNRFGRGAENSIHVQSAVHLFPRIADYLKARKEKRYGQSGFDDIFESPPFRALAQNNVELRETGNCGGGSSHADASVSELSLRANICFSIGNLTRLPKSVLLREILGLVLHEAVHLGGGEEAVAKEWQNLFKRFYEAQLKALGTDAVKLKTRDLLEKAVSSIDKAIQIANDNPQEAKILIFVGQARSQIAELPHFDDVLVLNFSLQPKKPWLSKNYSSAVRAFLDNAQGIEHGKKLLGPDFRQALEVMKAKLLVIASNFEAFVEGTAKSVCAATSFDGFSPGDEDFVKQRGNLDLPCADDVDPKTQTNQY